MYEHTSPESVSLLTLCSLIFSPVAYRGECPRQETPSLALTEWIVWNVSSIEPQIWRNQQYEHKQNIIDPYFADFVLPLIAQKRKDVEVVVVKNSRSKLLHDVDVAQFNAQYANSLTVKVSDRFHDRFLIIDKTTLIHVGASLNHLGKKCFAFSSLDKSNIPDILAKI